MQFPDEPNGTIEPGLKRMILIELIFPIILLVLGIYHGLMQVLYRSGMIRSRQVLGLEYFQGLTLHGVVNAIVFTTFFAVRLLFLGTGMGESLCANTRRDNQRWGGIKGHC